MPRLYLTSSEDFSIMFKSKVYHRFALLFGCQCGICFFSGTNVYLSVNLSGRRIAYRCKGAYVQCLDFGSAVLLSN